MIEFEFTDEQILLRKAVREFMEEELRPVSAEIDREAKFPEAVIRKMAKVGYLGAPVPEKYGGAGLGKIGYCILMEEIGRVDASVGTILGAHSSLGSSALLYYGTEEQKQRYLVPAARGEKLISFNLSEPGAGSDASSIQTTAVRDGDGYTITGSKMWATNGKEAGTYIVFAKTAPASEHGEGITAFVVERGMKGLSLGREEEKMGIRGSSTMQVFYDGVHVPENSVIGGEGKGFHVAMTSLDVGRISLSACSLGASERAIELAVDYSKKRVQFGRAISEQQAIQFKIAEMGMRTQLLRYITYMAAWRAEKLGTDPSKWKKEERRQLTREAAMAKCFGSETASFCVDESLQIHGGVGFVKSSEIERMYRDARISEIYEGTNEIQRMIVGRDIIRRGWV